MENNNVCISGKVAKPVVFSHECYGEKFYTTTVETFRTSGVLDNIPIIISERILFDNIDNKFVCIDGTVRTKNIDGKLVVIVFADIVDVIDERNDVDAVILDGYICKKNPIRQTPNGRVICDFILAVNRPFGKSDYIPVVSWGRNAQYIDGMEIGTKITIDGRLQSRIYTKDNEKKETYEISLQSVELI